MFEKKRKEAEALAHEENPYETDSWKEKQNKKGKLIDQKRIRGR
jgi:hypothetical protein